MPSKHKLPTIKADPTVIPGPAYRPFTRLAERGRASSEEFDREHMGIAAKE